MKGAVYNIHRETSTHDRITACQSKMANIGCLVPLLLTMVCSARAIPNGYFWQLTDIHYDPTYETTQESCNDFIENPGKYGDFECDSPWSLTQSSVKAMLDTSGTPDFILWTGDGSHHPKNHTGSTEEVLENLVNTTALIKESFSHTPVVVTLGNHDYYPVNQLPGETNAVYQAAANLWRDWLGSDEAYETFKRGAYYTVQLIAGPPNLRAVVINTNLYLPSNMATAGQEDPGDQLAWLREVLADARTNQDKVHMILHVPVGVMERTGNPRWITEDANLALNEIFREYADVILGMYSAHTHSDSFRVFYDDDGVPVTTMFIAPSVTPWRARIGNGVRTAAHNPGVRKVTFDKFDFSLTDVVQYYLDLDRANQQPSATWTFLYSFQSLYGVRDLQPASLHNLTQRFSQYANEDFHNYYDMNTVRSRQLSNEPCDCECKFEHICAMQNVDFAKFDMCKNTITCGARGLTVSMAVVAMVLLRALFFA